MAWIGRAIEPDPTIRLGQAERAHATKATFSITEQPLASWAFALRIWVAMMCVLYAAFWLQLDNAATSATTVAILAPPKRGQALHKAFYRTVTTVAGFAASIVIAGLLAQARDLFVLAFATWPVGYAYIARRFDGTRAYGAVPSGYEVAAVAQVDAPQDVFNTGISRLAVVLLGIASAARVASLPRRGGTDAGPLVAPGAVVGGDLRAIAAARFASDAIEGAISPGANSPPWKPTGAPSASCTSRSTANETKRCACSSRWRLPRRC